MSKFFIGIPVGYEEMKVPECYEEYTFNDDTESACNNQTSDCDHNCLMYREGFDS